MADSNSTPLVRPCQKCGGFDRVPSGACRPCAAAKYEANKPIVRQRQKLYRENNAEKINESRKANAHKHKAKKKAWDEANAEKLKSDRAAYWKENSDQLKVKRIAYMAEHGDEIRRNARERYKETYDPDQTWAKLNPERNRETTAAWRAANPDLRIIWESNRRARKRSSGGELSKDITEKLFKLQKGKCACCKLPLGDEFHMDHIMPLALGGQNTDDNIQLLRAECNLKKNKKHPIDFMQSRGFLL